jgi:hypothetical protein
MAAAAMLAASASIETMAAANKKYAKYRGGVIIGNVGEIMKIGGIGGVAKMA